ncbi:MAG: sugar transferase [Bacteroidaceae bacterium]|nr:sugar transferase [Bacteroidaceae bacterium]
MDKLIETKNIDGMNSVERFLKRTGDLLGAFLLLILLSPVFLIIYVMQKIEGEGPAIFKQERIGKGGKPFDILKFRTMKVEAEKEGIPQLATVGDDRLTKVGKFLREHHLDELPQLWNVFVGDMSFVGYRPERQYFISQIMEHNPDYVLLYVSRPGVTSNATLHNGYTDTMEKMLLRLDMDLDYLRHRSISLDFKIIFETAFSVVGGKKF